MKNLKLLAIIAAALVVGTVLAGCASMRLDHLETDTVDGPKQVRQGQDIDPKSITVWGIYQNGSRKVVSVGRSDITFNKNTPGLQTVKIRVGILTSQEVSFQTEVMALRSLTVASQPRTALFKIGTEPDPKWPGLEIRGEWDRMGSDKIDLASCEITGYMKDQSGKQTIKVSYEGLTATFDIDVRSMSGIQIVDLPKKKDYYRGDPLDLTGLKVMGLWGDGIPDEVLTVTRDDVTGFNTNNRGIQRLTITKNEKITNFEIEVWGLTSLDLQKPPTKTDYKVGENLDLTGIQVKGTYMGSTDTKREGDGFIPEENLRHSGYEPNRPGKQQRVTLWVDGFNEIFVNFFVNID